MEQGNAILLSHIREHTETCGELQFLLERIQLGDYGQWKKHPFIRPYLGHISEISMIEGVLFRGNEVIIIPKQLRREMIQLLHEWLSHPGENSLHNLVKAKYWYPQIRDHIRAVTTSCGTCQVIKPDTRREPFGIRPLPHCMIFAKTANLATFIYWRLWTKKIAKCLTSHLQTTLYISFMPQLRAWVTLGTPGHA